MQRLSLSDLEDTLKDCRIKNAIQRHKIVTYTTNGDAELASLIRKQLELRGQAVSSNPQCPAQASQMDDFENGHERDDASSAKVRKVGRVDNVGILGKVEKEGNIGKVNKAGKEGEKTKKN